MDDNDEMDDGLDGLDEGTVHILSLMHAGLYPRLRHPPVSYRTLLEQGRTISDIAPAPTPFYQPVSLLGQGRTISDIATAGASTTSSTVSQVENPVQEEPGIHWDITKQLTKTDVGRTAGRLLIPRKKGEEHLIPYLQEFLPNMDFPEAGIDINVYDVDTGETNVLKLDIWKHKSFVLIKKWMPAFVLRRKLEEKDEIGLKWDAENSRLMFSVLRRNN